MNRYTLAAAIAVGVTLWAVLVRVAVSLWWFAVWLFQELKLTGIV